MSKLMRAVGLAVACAGLLALGGGCADREHLRKDYGRRFHQRLIKQRIYRTAASGIPKGLDSEEAALIHAGYRKQMGGRQAREPSDSPAKVLLVQDTKKGR